MARTKQTARGSSGGKTPRKTIATKAHSKGAKKKTRRFTSKKRAGKKGEGAPGIKRTGRFRPGTVALRDMKKYMKTTDLLLRRAPFQRLVREVTQGWNDDVRFAAAALLALQEATEGYMIKLFEHMNIIAIHAKRVTILKRDFVCVVQNFRPDLKASKTPAPHQFDGDVLDENDARVASMIRRRVKRSELLQE